MQHSKIGRRLSVWGQNENPPRSGLCRLRPVADMTASSTPGPRPAIYRACRRCVRVPRPRPAPASVVGVCRLSAAAALRFLALWRRQTPRRQRPPLFSHSSWTIGSASGCSCGSGLVDRRHGRLTDTGNVPHMSLRGQLAAERAEIRRWARHVPDLQRSTRKPPQRSQYPRSSERRATSGLHIVL